MKTEVPPLTKAELQKALLHLIEVIISISYGYFLYVCFCSFQHDDNFLSCIHSAYMQTRSQNLS